MPDLFADPAAPTGKTTALTLSSLLERFTDVETESNGYVVDCPAHDDTKPSLRVGYNADTKKIALKCRAGCETSDVVAALGLTMSDLFDVQPGDLDDVRTAGAVPEKPSVGDRAALQFYLDRAAAYATQQLLGPDPAQQYAARRFGITPEKFSELGLGYDDGTVDGGKLILSRALYHDVARLVVPFYDFEGHAHYLQARSLVDGVKAKWSGPNNPEGASWGKFGVFKGGSGWAEVIVTEGPGDALTVAALGYDAVLIRGAGLGNNVALADELAHGLHGRRVVIAGDADNAGVKFTRDVADALSKRGIDVHKLTIPVDGGNDVSKWRELAGAAFDRAFVQAVQEAPRYGSDQITAEGIAQEITRLFSDVYNAKTLLNIIREQGGDVRHTEEAGWIVYKPNAGTWEIDRAEWVRTQAQEVAARVQRSILDRMQSMDSRVAAMDDKDLRDSIGQLLDAQRRKARSGSLVSYVMSTRGIDSMLRELRALPGVHCKLAEFDRHHDLLAVRNGVVNLETGELSPSDEHTKDLLLLRRVDQDYIPGARNPRWEKFLEEVFEGHDGLAAYIQRLVGYGITGYTSEQCFGVLFGTGANGKSVFTDTLATIFEGITATAAFETFEQQQGNSIRSDIARLNGARMVLTEEGKQGAPMAENTLKLLTGQGKVTARFLYGKEFEFHPSFLIMMASNYRPVFKGADEGIWRRVRLIPFSRWFAPSERDKYLPQKFTGQRVPDSAWREGEDYGDGPAGILAWAVRGAMEWYRTGLNEPGVVTASTGEYRKTSDALGPFYSEYLVKDQNGRITGKDVWGMYQDWTEEEGLDKKERWKRATFWSALEERGAVKTLPGGIVTFKGIRKRRPSDPHVDAQKFSEEERADQAQLADVHDTEAPSLEPFEL